MTSDLRLLYYIDCMTSSTGVSKLVLFSTQSDDRVV
jgi:hypothetical protein